MSATEPTPRRIVILGALTDSRRAVHGAGEYPRATISGLLRLAVTAAGAGRFDDPGISHQDLRQPQ